MHYHLIEGNGLVSHIMRAAGIGQFKEHAGTAEHIAVCAYIGYFKAGILKKLINIGIYILNLVPIVQFICVIIACKHLAHPA